MTDKLPPNLLALFAPRPALRYLPPADFAPEDRKTHGVSGVAQYLPQLKEEFGEYKPTESWLEAKDRKTLEKQEKQKYTLTDGFKNEYKPTDDEKIRGDAFKTLFVARLSYDTDIKDLEREFGRFGPIERIRIVQGTGETDKKNKGKSRGYAFVVYEREKDMKAAYKETDGIRIRDRRVLVDVERGRTVSGWRPRRFGGGLGGRGYTKAAPAKPTGFGPPMGPGGFRGGFRGGFGDRGGFRGRGDFGDRGRGGFRGGFGGGRGGIGYQSDGGFGAPNGAPSGPRGGFGGGGGYGGDRGGYGGGGRSYDDRGPRNANYEPLPPRGGGDRGGGDRGGYRDRDSGGFNGGQKRPYEGGGGGYEESRSRRRY